jgi:competence protein ComEC
VTARRPLSGAAIGLALGILVGLHGTPLPGFAVPAIALGLVPPLTGAGFAVAGWWAATASAPGDPPAPAGTRMLLEGRVVSVPDRLPERVRFRLRTASGALVEVLAPPAPWPLALGDLVRLPCELRAPAGPRNPGGRDPAGRLRASGVSIQARATGPAVRLDAPSAATRLERARDALAAAAARFLPPREAALMRAISTGDRAGLDPDTNDAFARSGLAHVLAVSGFHLVVVALGLERLLGALFVRLDGVAERLDPRRLSAAIALPVAVVYAVAAGAGVPVLRAVVAAGAALAGVLLDREADAANALGLAALAVLAGEPGALLDPSLQLSFAAVAGLVGWAGPLRRRLPIAVPPRGSWRARVVEPLVAGACATAAASLATAPILALHFRQLPVLGLAANVAGLPLGTALTVLGALAAVAAAASPLAAAPVLVVAWPFASALLALSDATAAPSWSVVGLASPGLLGAGSCLALAFLGSRLRGAPRLAAWGAAGLCLLAPGTLRAGAARARGGLEVIFVSVGHGDATLLRLPDGSAVLVDAGGSPGGGPDPGARDVVPLLRDLGVRRLAAVFVSHPDPDHVLGLEAVATAVPIDLVFSNGDGGTGDARALLARLAPIALLPGDGWSRAGVRFDVLGGAREAFAPNDASMVLRVRYGETTFLLPGDVEADGEAAAVARGGLAADVVKVPHHGSRTSSTAAFVAAVRPRFAVVSVDAENRHGFPHPEPVARWRDVGAEVVRTDGGAVRFLSDGRSLRRVPAAAVLDPLAVLRERP